MGSGNSSGKKVGTDNKSKDVRWEVVDEKVEDNRFQNRQWVPRLVTRNKRHALPKETFSIRMEEDDKECFVTGAAFLPNGDMFIVDQSNRKLKLFNSKCQYKTGIQMPVNPEGVCSIPKKPYVYVTFPGSCKVRQVEVSNDDMIRLETFQTIGKCTGISNNSYGGIAVAVNIVGNQWQIHLLNSKGQMQKRVHGEQLFLNPAHIAVTRDMNLIISDKGNNTVFHITPEGYVVFAYKDIRNPADVFVDKLGYIYVAGPEKVHQINERGDRVHLLLSKVEVGFPPLTMAYREKDEMLLIAGKSDKVRLFALK